MLPAQFSVTGSGRGDWRSSEAEVSDWVKVKGILTSVESVATVSEC